MKKEDLLYIRTELETLKKANKQKEIIDDYNLVLRILTKYKIAETLGIYVCTHASFFRDMISLLDTEVYSEDLDIDTKVADTKFYCDIENDKYIVGTGDKEEALRWKEDRVYISDFERENIVLNPYNTSKDLNGLLEVKKIFWENTLKYGQEESKQLLLSKYPKL